MCVFACMRACVRHLQCHSSLRSTEKQHKVHCVCIAEVCVSVSNTYNACNCEAPIDAMANMYAGEDTKAMVLVVANNAFNRLNRQVALHKTEAICPDLAPIFINTYRDFSWLLIDGESTIRCIKT